MLTERDWQNLYIHVPFCAGKCDYCAFYSEGNSTELMPPYTEKIIHQIAELKSDLIHTVYLGGGTPTLLPPELLEEILSVLHSHIPQVEEFSIECNPESLTEEKARILGKHVHRVSLGIQSFHKNIRQKIGRRGDPDKIGNAIRLLKKNGIKNIGCDLIYAIPDETDQEWQDDLEQALALGIQHLSAYSLIVEEGTPLSKRCHLEQDTSNRAAELEKITREFVHDAGMNRYEVSNYALPGFECKHNLNVWYGETYAGLGPAACSFNGIDRFTQIANLAEWLAGTPPETDRIPDSKRLAEILIMGLRTTQGWADGIFEKNTGFDPEKLWKKEFAELRTNGMMKPDSCALTEHGLDFWNDAAEIFF